MPSCSSTARTFPNGKAAILPASQGHRGRLHQHPQDGPNPNETSFRRLPASRRMGHAQEARRQQPDVGQQRRLFARANTNCKSSNRTTAKSTPTASPPRSTARRRRWSMPRGSRANGSRSTSSLPRRNSTATSLLKPAYFTVFWNGVLVQNHTASLGPTRHREVAKPMTRTRRPGRSCCNSTARRCGSATFGCET
jgi:hypothetical protein